MNKQKHTHGFKIPEGYFDTFEDRLFDKVASEKIPKETGFVVPEGYFEQIEETISTHPKITRKDATVRPLFSKRNLKYAIAVAASITLIVLLFNQNKSMSFDVNTVDYIAIENYINDGELDFDVYDVSSLISENDDEILNYETETISEENMESYLLETVDESTLLNE